MNEFSVEPEYLVSETRKNEKAFSNVLNSSAPFEIKGILNSEMLLFVTLIDLLGVSHVIESGRARGQSTEIIARWLAGGRNHIRFDSIEFDQDSEDVAIAEKRIRNSGYPVGLHYGDAFELLPKIIRESKDEKIILIDGPKGINAVSLAIDALGDNKVKAVCIHDIHKDDTELRNLVESNWPILFASDDKSFVDSFLLMDEPCWAEHQKYPDYREWGPYRRGEQVMKSYGPTLTCLVNLSISRNLYDKALVNVRREKSKIDRRKEIVRTFGKFLPDEIKSNSVFRRVARFILNYR